jgi:hypothetical protein
MKKIVLLLSVFSFSSCNQNQTTINNINRELNTAKMQVDTVEKKIFEKTLKVQLNDYMVAFFGGDPDKAIGYIYPDVFDYLIETYPDEKIDMEQLKQSLKEPAIEMKENVKKKHIKYSFEIGEFTNKVDLGREKIYVVLTYVYSTKGLNKSSSCAECVSITKDWGKTWKFFQKDSTMTEPILKKSFPEEVVRQIVTK